MPSTQAFAELRAKGVTELVLDLRYNGGGLVSVAQHLASLIGGVRTNGQVLSEYFHNDRNAFRNRVLRFEPKAHALALDRLVVITTRSSASASELVINALRPFMPVLVIGDRTYGKPVGQYGITFCDKVLAPVSFTLRNANGEGDYFDGIAPTCSAPDDLERQLGDPQEGSLREALNVITTGHCSTPPTGGLAPLRRPCAPACVHRLAERRRSAMSPTRWTPYRVWATITCSTLSTRDGKGQSAEVTITVK
jgi:C-terminal processing protease CtpA/Prc